MTTLNSIVRIDHPTQGIVLAVVRGIAEHNGLTSYAVDVMGEGLLTTFESHDVENTGHTISEDDYDADRIDWHKKNFD